MQLFDFAPEAIDMIIAAIVYCGALSLLFKEIINRFYKRSLKKTKTKQEDKEKL